MSSVADWLKAVDIKPRYFFGIAAIGLLLLFLPENIANRFGVCELRSEYGGWIGAGTIAAMVFWMVQLLPLLSEGLARRKSNQKLIRELLELPDAEWFLLAYCLERNKRRFWFDPDAPIIDALHIKDMIRPIATYSGMRKHQYTIPDGIWKYMFFHKGQFFPENIRTRKDIVEAMTVYDEKTKHPSEGPI